MDRYFSILILAFFAASVFSQTDETQDDYPVEELIEPIERGVNTQPKYLLVQIAEIPQSQGRQIKAKGRQTVDDLGSFLSDAGKAISSGVSSAFDSLAKGKVGIPNSAIKQSVQQGGLGSISGGKGGKGNSMSSGSNGGGLKGK